MVFVSGTKIYKKTSVCFRHEIETNWLNQSADVKRIAKNVHYYFPYNLFSVTNCHVGTNNKKMRKPLFRVNVFLFWATVL